MARKEIPFCPLMTAGSEVDRVCSEDRCAWYVPNVQKCSMYMLAYNALLEAGQKQSATTKK